MAFPATFEQIGTHGSGGAILPGAAREVIQGTAATTLTAAQSGALCIFTQATTGGTFTLPAPVVGLTFDFVTLVSVTSSDVNKVITNAATVFLTGGVAMASLTAGGNDFFEANGTTFVAITMGASTTGGLKGGRIRVTCISPTLWHVEGIPVGSGTLADPFATS